MTALRLVGWEKGAQTVSLMAAVREYGDVSLAQAKNMVEALLDGKIVVIEFADLVKMETFRRVAIEAGAKCE